MNKSRNLAGRRIAVLAADGFEKIELTVPMKALQLAGAEVHVVSLRHGRIRGVNLHEPAGRVAVTKTVHETTGAEYDGLFIPGGYINPDLLRQSAEARRFVRSFVTGNKPIATICHGSWVLASAEVLRGRKITSWPGIRDDMVNAGAVWLDQEVVRDENLLTSRGPQDLDAFVPAMISLYSGAPAQASVALGAISAPPADQPPRAILTAMKWLPRPSVRAAMGLGAVTFGLVAMMGRKGSTATVSRALGK